MRVYAESDSEHARVLTMADGTYQLTGPASAAQGRKVDYTAAAQQKGFWDNFGSLTTAQGSNRDLLYQAVGAGTAGNAIRVRYVISGNSTPLTVSVSGNDITVNVATDSGGAATSTANQVKAAVQASTPASALVQVALAPGSDGTGVVQALSFTALAGGTDSTRGPVSNAQLPHQHPISNTYK